MSIEYIKELIRNNREIEFFYHKHRYSITYYDDGRKNYISVCEFYEKPFDVSSPEEVLRLKIGQKTLEQIFKELHETDFDIY